MTKIYIDGYKSIFNKSFIEIKGLTILSGANSSGKSSFMQPLLLLKQTLESNIDTGALLLHGPNIKITDSSQAFYKNNSSKLKKFSIQVESKTQNLTITAEKDLNLGIKITNVYLENKEFPDGINVNESSSSDEISSKMGKIDNPFLTNFIKNVGKHKYKVRRNKCFFEILCIPEGENENTNIKIGFNPTSEFEKMLGKIIHVPGLRGNPERSYRISNSATRFAGSFESYVASIIHNWKNSKKEEEKRKIAELIDDIKSLKLGNNLSTTKINDTQIEIKISRHCNSKSNDLVDIADVGFGVTQILPVLTALIIAKKGDLVYIEQPELHLHPKAQYQLSNILSKATAKGINVVIETHSSILIRGLQTLTASKKLDKDKINLHWFSQDRYGKTIINNAHLDENGAFGDWPVDFDDIHLEADKNYLEAVENNIID